MFAKSFLGRAGRFLAACLHNRGLIAALCLVPALFLCAADARAASTYTVTVLTDNTWSGNPNIFTGNAANCPANGIGPQCSLRDAITAADNDSGSTIVFAVTGTMYPAYVLAEITTSMNIVGPGANLLSISGSNRITPLGIPIPASATVTISGLTFINGNDIDYVNGGAINTRIGTLQVVNCIFVNNSSGSGGEGGAIYNISGTVQVSNSTFIGNSAQLGGAIYNESGGTLSVVGSTFQNNAAQSGGAIYNNSTTTPATVVNSTFVGNASASYGGAIDNNSGANLTIDDSTFSGNLAVNSGRAIENIGTLTVNNTVVSGATDCDGLGCPIDGTNGNVVGRANLNLSALGNWGGPTPTILPLAGSAAICAGSASLVPTLANNVDQRGFILLPSSCPAGSVDAGAVQTNYLTVTTAADDPPGYGANCPGASCSLRDAVTVAMAASGGNADVNFAPALTGSTISLAAPLPAVSAAGAINIVGPGASQLTVSGAGAWQIFNLSSGTLNISGLTLANGKTAGYGGAVDNTGGTLILSNAALTGNTAASGGGAVNSAGTLLVNGSTFSGNTSANGSAVSNTGAMNMLYSTVAANSVTTSGGLYNGGSLTIANSTLAGNSGPSPGIYNLGTLSIANSLLDSGSECVGSGCPSAAGNGNVVGATNLASLGSYGGGTMTVLPQPGSTALCQGAAALIPSGATTDQRGFPNQNIAYSGYSTASPCIDAGAVQTNYTSAQFVGTPPYVTAVNTPGQLPPVIVSITENGQSIGGVPLTLAFAGTGTASGLTATTVGGAGANFSSLQVNQPSGASPDTLSVSIPVVGADALSAGPVDLVVNPQSGTTPAFAVSNASATVFASSVNLSASVTSSGKAVNEGQVIFMVAYPGGGSSVTGPVSNGMASVSYPLPAHLAVTSYTITATFTDLGGSYNTATSTAQLAITKAAPTVSVWPAASAITYGQALSSSILTGGTASVAGAFAFTSPATVPTAGTASQSVTFTPADSADYSTVTGTVSVTVNKATPVITWPTPAPINYGMALSATQLNATANAAGTFVYSPAAGTVPAAGSDPLSVTFTPTDSKDYNVATATVTLVVNNVGTPIVPYIQVNNGSWQATASVTVNYGDSVNLGPQPLTGGSWKWSGPNGYSSTSRQINNIPLTSATNSFVATYTNPAGFKTTQTFTITIAPTPITPYIEVNGGAWQQTAILTVASGASVNLGPQVTTSGGSWSWSGPNGYKSTSRQINSVPLTAPSNVFVATYTNPAGVKSTATFTINIPTPIVPYLQVNGGAWQSTASVIVAPGSKVNLGPQPLTGGSWSWSGPSGFKSTSREIDNIPLALGIDLYVVTYTNSAGVTSTQTFTIVVL